jgi:hypothetical protein
MGGLLWETSWVSFVVITLLLAGGAAWMSGRALARSWRPLGLVFVYMVLLGAAARFFHWSLGGETLLTLHYYLVDTIVLIGIGALSWRVARTTQMVEQYPWLYRRTSPVSWTDR